MAQPLAGSAVPRPLLLDLARIAFWCAQLELLVVPWLSKMDDEGMESILAPDTAQLWLTVVVVTLGAGFLLCRQGTPAPRIRLGATVALVGVVLVRLGAREDTSVSVHLLAWMAVNLGFAWLPLVGNLLLARGARVPRVWPAVALASLAAALLVPMGIADVVRHAFGASVNVMATDSPKGVKR